ncbi:MULTISPECIES: hypothetical protein [Aequorivita]|uniref:Lipoprotein n=2 Tax=Aequorivita TaxID=153265 RepID=A0AB35YTY3_9FLAO|nr:hypothetical protein [Aequorivita sp. Ant34-E75]WGF92313.1 hypothetical protein QCQ61_14020 [Aequorivita sp. Ant34-E75]
MKFLKITLLLLVVISLTSCASGYKTIQPKTINFLSNTVEKGVKLEYKYDLLYKKYEKNEVKKGVKLVAIKVTNESDKSLMFGRDVKLVYANGTEVPVMENDRVFKKLKQSPASYLLFLLLTPLNLYTTETNPYGVQETNWSFPVGVVLGPGLAAGNLLAASSANSNFKSELMIYDLNGMLINPGETKYGLIGIKTDSPEALRLKVE